MFPRGRVMGPLAARSSQYPSRPAHLTPGQRFRLAFAAGEHPQPGARSHTAAQRGSLSQDLLMVMSGLFVLGFRDADLQDAVLVVAVMSASVPLCGSGSDRDSDP